MIFNPSITVFLSTHNRPQLALESLKTLLNQSYDNKKIIVSDNSSDNYTEIFLKKNFHEFNEFRYIKRPNLDPHDHFNLLIDEIETEYCMFFHDDDLLESDFIEKALKKMEKNKNISCVGGNAKIIDSKGNFIRFLNRPIFFHDLFIDSNEQFFDHYFNYKPRLPAPFPSYIYRSKFIKNISSSAKHLDVEFISRTIKEGNILWLKDICMSYRVHRSQDSFNESIVQRKKLIQFLYKKKDLSLKKKAIYKKNIRLLYWRKFFLNDLSKVFVRRYNKALFFTFFTQLFLIFRHPFYFLIKLFNKSFI